MSLFVNADVKLEDDRVRRRLRAHLTYTVHLLISPPSPRIRSHPPHWPTIDDQTLEYYNIKAESVVYLRVRGEGGKGGKNRGNKRLRGGSSAGGKKSPPVHSLVDTSDEEVSQNPGNSRAGSANMHFFSL